MLRKMPCHVVIIGAGFGGLYATKELVKKDKSVKITLIDRRNFHLFQPLLYQVASGKLAAEDIIYPVRTIFSSYQQVTVLQDKVIQVNPDTKTIQLTDQIITYDILIIATGMRTDYLSHKKWEVRAKGLKTIEDALEIRSRVLKAFEKAESNANKHNTKKNISFVVIGGGPTGVELSGALSEISRRVLRKEFRNIIPENSRVYLVEASEQILSDFPRSLVEAAKRSLERLGVTILTNTLVEEIDDHKLEMRNGDSIETLVPDVIIWTAGVRAANEPSWLGLNNSIQFDKKGRIFVDPFLRLQGYEDIFVIGDLAFMVNKDNQPLPGIAPVAMQQGKYAARYIAAVLKKKQIKPFHYRNKGILAVIGRNAAVADFGFVHFSGFFAWLLWVFVHIAYLIGFKNKTLVLFQWAWNYMGNKPGARLILDR